METEQPPFAPEGAAAHNAERWRRVRSILGQALALPEHERASFVAQACAGDDSGRLEVESLIRAAERTAVIDQPALLTDELRSLPPGACVGAYEILNKLGQGGMGVVYLARDPRLDRHVALKVLSKADGSHQERARFLREARAASALNHPNIVTIYEFDSAGDMDYIAMEYIQGQTLRQLLDQGELPLANGLDYARQVASGLARAHGAGIVHRDLKPQNIMITGEGVAKILDFGLARRMESPETGPDDSTTLTRVGTILGTPAYMSPEQVSGDPVDYRSDIFSFGIVLYEIVCGEQPFRAANPRATMHRIAAADPPQPADGARTPSRRLAHLIDHCLKKKPADRLQSMAEAVEQLTAMARSSPAPSPNSRVRIAAAAVVLAVSLAGGIWYMRKAAIPAAVGVSPLPARTLTCSLEAQQLRDGRPTGEPGIVSADQVFEGTWRLRLRAQLQQAGYLYMVDEGPDSHGDPVTTVLFPGERVSAGQTFETKWYRLEGKAGIERLWIVWSNKPVPELDGNNPSQARRLLAGLPAQRQIGDSIKLRTLTDVVAGLWELRHQ